MRPLLGMASELPSADSRELVQRVIMAFFTDEFQGEMDAFLRAKAPRFAGIKLEQVEGADNKLE